MATRFVSRRSLAVAIGLLLMDMQPSLAEVQLLSLGEVQLTSGPFLRAQQINRQYLLAHDPDRLLAPFRVAAGLQPKGELYPNWESSGLGGQTAGHYLTALANMVAATGDQELMLRLAYMVADLAQIQKANGNSYVGGVPDSRELWQQVAAGDIRAEPFGLNGKWVPWYNMHKLFAGLRDAWLVAGIPQARDVLLGLADWCDELVKDLSDEQMQDMLRAEHGGMNEVLADIYAATREEKYLTLAQRFSHRQILNPLLAGQDRLTGLHANTQIPKVIGYARIGELSGDKEWIDAARFFWETVASNRSVAIGGNSVREHFQPADDFSSMIESTQGPETCNTYNMLRLTELLFRLGPEARYADYYERALYNHILASQHPRHGGFVYMTPMRPRHYRVYSQPEQCFWCCVGSGMENHTKYGQFIYAHSDDALYVNLFVPSELRWQERNVLLRQLTAFPDANESRLVLSMGESQEFTLNIRWPAWAGSEGFAITVNGEALELSGKPSSYVAINRQWQNGDQVEIALPTRTHLERLPDGSDFVSVLHGPIVLAAKTSTDELEGLVADDSRMGHIAHGEQLPLDRAPMFVGSEEDILAAVKPVPDNPLTFTAAAAIRPDSYDDLKLIPFFRLHDARYMIYWRTATPEEYAEVLARIEREEQERMALAARTIDEFQPGEQQPEVEHNYQGEGSTTGTHLGRRYRDARGWFSYDFEIPADTPLELQVTYFSGDRGREFDILANDQVIGSFELRRRGEEFVDVTYPIPEEITSQLVDGKLTIKFHAREGSTAGGVYGLRLLKAQ
jgi:DUF1680 family protein